MPIKPPRLDDRSYDDLVREARALIPQYCPEWTNLSDADPGMTLVQLFAWMTELTLYRLNRVPDKTYVHFLNFIGEERRTAQPARVPLTFALRTPHDVAVELAGGTRCATRQRSGGEALHFLTTGPLTVHAARIDRILAVVAGERPRVRELPFAPHPASPQALTLDGGRGLQPFQLHDVDDGPRSWTPDQHVWLRHDDLIRMASLGEAEPGSLRLRSTGDPGLPIAALFAWSYPGPDQRFLPLVERDGGEVIGLPERLLPAELPGLAPITSLGEGVPVPEGTSAHGWVRGEVRYERWLACLMEDELRVTWRDDRGGEEREITHWYVRDVGRTIELSLQNLPPLRAGWALRLTMVDHGLRAGADHVFPAYRWSWRRGDRWVAVPPERVARLGASFVLQGPFPEMAADGFNLRAERVEALDVEALLPGLQAELVWRRPITLALAAGPDADAAIAWSTIELPQEPFQPAPGVPAMLGTKLFLGSDLLANRRRAPIALELELGFERGGEPVTEPVDDYHLQLTYRTASGWQVVPGGDGVFTRFRLADLDPEGVALPGSRRLRIVLDPRAQLDGLVPATIAGQDTAWLRVELTRAQLSWRKDDKSPSVPVSLRLYAAMVGLAEAPGALAWEEPLTGTKVVVVEHRPTHRRFTRVLDRHEGAVRVSHPFDGHVVLDADDGGGHHALYLRFDRPLPAGHRLATMFRCRGEAWLPHGTTVTWELLQGGDAGRRWTRLASSQDPGGAYTLERTGTLVFSLDAPVRPAPEGVWLRAIVRGPSGELTPLPPITHVLPNTIEAVNLHPFGAERFSGEGVPSQVLQLQHFPVHVPTDGDVGMRVSVEEEDGQRRPWRIAPGNRLASVGKDERVFAVDPVEGTLTFGNGLRGRILPVGSFNVIVEGYLAVPGAAGNVAAGEVTVIERAADPVDVTNVVPGVGGRDAESIDEIIRRAPSVLTSRDRAVTRSDFEALAGEASPEVARAAAGDHDGEDGTVEVVILPRRRAGEALPDPFLAAGLEDHVQAWLAKRCLVNVRPRVRLATFQAVDVAIDARLRPGANRIAAREHIEAWIRRFLDPYVGGLDASGWTFGATLYAQDFARLVVDVADVRHVVDVRVHPVDEPAHAGPAWEVTVGESVLPLRGADLLHARHVRVRFADEVDA